jgi:hypothetical protein
MPHQVLALDSAGSPNRWIPLRDAVVYHAKGLVAWSIGEPRLVMHGGTNRVTGNASQIATASVIAIKGHDFMVRNFDRVPTVDKSILIKRDRHTCAYCGNVFKACDLELEHIIPKSRKGPESWTNLVSACRNCNCLKRDRTPEEAGMPLLYLPYVPNTNEVFIMSGRNILADQMDFLRAGVPKHSRLL